MWTEENKKGVVYRERYIDPLTGKYKKVSVSYPKDTAQNRKKAQSELLRLIDEKTQEGPKDATIGSVIESYLNYCLHNSKNTTYKTYSSEFGYILEYFDKDIIINNLTIAKFNEIMRSSGKSVTRINRHIKLLKIALKWSYENDIHNNLALISKIKFIKETKPEKNIEDEFLTPSEVEAVLSYYSDHESWGYYYFTKFLLLTGCRVGEAVALTVDDILQDKIVINKTFYYNTQTTGAPKSSSSFRDIYIQPELAEFLKEYRVWRNEQLILRGIRTDLFFVGSRTSKIDHRSYNSSLKRVKLQKNIHPHIFRHTHASILAENGMTYDEIALRLGHSDSGITKKIYVHVTEKAKEKTKAKLSKIKII